MPGVRTTIYKVPLGDGFDISRVSHGVATNHRKIPTTRRKVRGRTMWAAVRLI